MPIYEYRCTTCDHRIEVFAKISDPPPLACEACNATTLTKVLHPVAVHYKGSGFYATDYGSKRGSGDDRGSSASEQVGDSKSSGVGGDSKSGGDASGGDTGQGSAGRTDKGTGGGSSDAGGGSGTSGGGSGGEG